MVVPPLLFTKLLGKQFRKLEIDFLFVCLFPFLSTVNQYFVFSVAHLAGKKITYFLED